MTPASFVHPDSARGHLNGKIMLLTRKAEFSASHVCSDPALSPEENRAVYGVNAHPAGHGHNFVLEVTIEGDPDPVTGMVFDLRQLKEIINQEVVDPMDHRFLNCEVAPFTVATGNVVPTTENLAMEIWKRLAPRIQSPSARLHNVRLFETADLYIDYRGEAA